MSLLELHRLPALPKHTSLMALSARKKDVEMSEWGATMKDTNIDVAAYMLASVARAVQHVTRKGVVYEEVDAVPKVVPYALRSTPF
jgi:hypothetical protein